MPKIKVAVIGTGALLGASDHVSVYKELEHIIKRSMKDIIVIDDVCLFGRDEPVGKDFIK